jgi:hypothetical protein
VSRGGRRGWTTVTGYVINWLPRYDGAGVVKLVDAGDSKSPEVHASCRFESDLRHHFFKPLRIRCGMPQVVESGFDPGGLTRSREVSRFGDSGSGAIFKRFLPVV